MVVMVMLVMVEVRGYVAGEVLVSLDEVLVEAVVGAVGGRAP